MFQVQTRQRRHRSNIRSNSAARKTRVLQCACEQVESRLLLSTVTFATPTTISVPGAEAPLVAGRYEGSSSPEDIAVATPTAVQILDGSSNGVFTLGISIPLPADPAAINPFQEGDFTGSGSEDLVLDSHNAGTGNGELTYEASNGDGTFTAGTVTNITDGGVGFTPIAGKSGSLNPNTDSDDDLAIVGKPGTGSQLVLAVMISDGAQGFTETDIPIVGSNAAGNTSNEEIVTDVTNEIVLYDGSSGNLDVFSSAGDGNFTQLTPTPLTANLIVGGTFNDNQDLVVANGSEISVLQNQGNGTFQADPQGPITLPGTISSLDIGDFDLDGNNDIITNQGILIGNGDETFNTTPQALPATLDGGNNVSNTMQAVFLGNNRQGFVGFASSGNSIVTAVNESPAQTSVDVSSSNNPANPGSDVQLTASISALDSNFTGTPTGTVTFFNNSTQIGSATLSDGSATVDIGSSLSGAANSITATYSGDATFAASTSTALQQTVLSPTVTTLSSNENPSNSGDDVVFTAVVTGNDGAGDVPSGNVEFFDNGVDLGGGSLDSTGTATFDTTGTFTVGSHPITAQYQADSNFAGSESSVLTQTVNQPGLTPSVAATTLPSAIVAGSAVHGNVTVTITNQTSGKLGAEHITVFASSNGSIANATPIVIDPKTVFINGGQTKSVKITVKSFPSTLGDGTYSLVAQVTSSLDQQSNSIGGPSVNVAAPFVQLAGVGGTGLVKPNLVKAGKAVTVTIELTNSGNITSGLASVGIGLSTDGQTESTVLESTAANIKIKPGKKGPLRLHFQIPANVADGSYQPYVTITDDGDSTTVIGQSFTVED